MLASRRALLAVTSALVLGTVAATAPALSTASPSSQSTATHAAAHRTSGDYTSKVVGVWRNGTVRGSFVPVRSFVRHGQTFVQGDLTAKVLRDSGRLVGKTTRHDVSVPVKASGAHTTAARTQQQQATCSILHLVLGPLDLNLLGLKVHLNKVVLDITAQSGSGNLLGNLLCAVAHLLDGTSPSLLDLLRLGSLLNRILGQIT